MTIAWVLYVLATGTLLALGALAGDRVLRRVALPTRWAWVAALAGMAFLAALSPRREDPSTDRATPVIGTAREARDAILSSFTRALVAAEERVPASLAGTLVIAWGASSAVLLTLVILVNRRLARARREWPVARVRGLSVRIAPAVGPAVIGLARPEIVVPRWLLDKSPEEQQLVIVHEAEHVTAHDQVVLTSAWLLAALFPWHPAVWWSLSRLRLAIELDCDARVLKRGVAARRYGSLLIDIAGKHAGHRMGALALADRSSHLERRLVAMKRTRTRFSLLTTGALGGFAMVAGILACEARLPTSADVSRVDTVEVATLETKLANVEGLVRLEAKIDNLDADVGQATYQLVRLQVESSKALEFESREAGKRWVGKFISLNRVPAPPPPPK